MTCHVCLIFRTVILLYRYSKISAQQWPHASDAPRVGAPAAQASPLPCNLTLHSRPSVQVTPNCVMSMIF